MSRDKDTDLDSLIGELTEELTPVKRVWRPALYITPWFVLTLAYLAGVIHFLGLRMDLMEQMQQAPFLFEVGLALGIAVTAAYTAGWLAVPDMQQKRWMLAVPTTLFGVFLLWVLCDICVKGVTFGHIHWHHCFSDALLMGFVPVATLCLLVRRGATTQPGWMTFMSVLAVGALGWVSLRFTCMADGPSHILVFHFLPFIFMAAVLGILARRIYRW